VNGKTGMRRLRIIASTPYLSTWMNNHPLKESPEAPLWIGIGTRNKNEIMTYSSINALLRKLGKRAGIKKRLNPHTFRHSRATYLANHLTEAQMNQLFGWVQGSDMPSTYVHLSGRDVDKALLKIYGLAKDEAEKEESPLKPKKCVRCDETNPVTSKFCNRCGMVLDVETAMFVEDERSVSDELLTAVLKKNPDLSRRIVEAALEMGLKEKLREMV
jgi:ribosomal protein L40E